MSQDTWRMRGQDCKPEYSPASVARFPAPERQFYFCGRDYAAACLRTHEKRVQCDRDAGRQIKRDKYLKAG